MASAGQNLGPYVLLSRLGAGAMGEVWKARDERLGRMVALKTLPTASIASDEQRSLILREARAAAAVPHAGVVTLYDVVSTDDEDFLVMELVEGKTLQAMLADSGACEPRRAVELLIQISSALEAAHERGILHRDVKSANVMVKADGTIKVLDFGLAKLRESDFGVVTEAVCDQASIEDLRASPTAAVDATLVAASGAGSGTGEVRASGTSSSDPLGTVAGDFIGTPLYMSPEQVLGERPDARSEVFSVGILAYEILAGAPPYKARKLDELFAEIHRHEFAPLPSTVPAEIRAIVERATELERDKRFATMAELRQALEAARAKHFGQRRRAWPWLAAAAALAAVLVAIWMSRPAEPEALPSRPGDPYVERALQEYEVFYNQKAASSLRAALKVDPEHPRALAYLVFFDALDEGERAERMAQAQNVLRGLPEDARRDRALLGAAVALATRGAPSAREALARAEATPDRELAFWSAELAYRARDYQAAAAGYRTLLHSEAQALRGRIYDHYSSVLLYQDDTEEAVAIGKLYADAFPGEADAVGVYATTLAAAGQMDEALRLAQEAVRLSPTEDTYAGLGKVYAYRGQLAKAREAYRTSLTLAQPSRRVLRRAALGMLHLIDGRAEEAAEVLSPCLPGGEDGAVFQRGPCLFVAGLRWPEKISEISAELEALASAGTELEPPYGFPHHLAELLQARADFTGGGCVLPRGPGTLPIRLPADPNAFDARLAGARDFYAEYHVPFFSLWSRCERAALALARGELARARTILEPADSGRRLPVLLLLADIARAEGRGEHRAILERAAKAWPELDPGSLLAERLSVARSLE